jgi:uncharacterized protein YggE
VNTRSILILLAAGVSGFAQPQTINVSGDAELKVAPDQAVLSLGVEVHSKLFDEARHENDRRIRAIRAAVARLGVDEKDVQTDFIQVGIVYENDGVTPKFFNTQKSVVIVLHDVSKMEAVLASALDAGATHVHSIDFQTTRLREFRDQARALAVKAAGEKARDMAAAAGLKTAGPIGISGADYGTRSWYGNWWGNQRLGMSQNVYQQNGMSGGPVQGTVAPGRISVTATVAMTFRLE